MFTDLTSAGKNAESVFNVYSYWVNFTDHLRTAFLIHVRRDPLLRMAPRTTQGWSPGPPVFFHRITVGSHFFFVCLFF